MQKPRIVFLDEATVNLGDVDLSTLAKQGTYKGYTNTALPHIFQRAKNADIIITNKFVFNHQVIKKLPKLKLLCVAATGVNNIDLEACRKRGISVTNVPAYSTTTVAEHALLFILAFAHRFLEHHQAGVKGHWAQSKHFALFDYPFSDICGKKLGIIGYGKIGRQVKRLAENFGMKVIVGALPGRKYSKKEKRAAFKYLLKNSDFVSLHCPLSKLTHHLIGAKELKLMKKTAYLINMARGPIVDEKAIVHALKKKEIAGYGTDVLSEEPPRKNHPLLRVGAQRAFAPLLVTPHVAWASRESRQRLVDEIAENIAAFKSGRKGNRVV